MLNQATKTTRFFCRENNSNYPFWRLKSPDEHEVETNIRSKEGRKYIFNCLDDMAQVNVPTELDGLDLLAEKSDRREFIDLLKRMLTLDQERRITPGEALNHSFVVLNHLIEFPNCSVLLSSAKMMEVCRRRIFSNHTTNNHHHHHSSSGSSLVNGHNSNVVGSHQVSYDSNAGGLNAATTAAAAASSTGHQTMAIIANNFNSPSAANAVSAAISFNNHLTATNNNVQSAAANAAAAAAAAAYQFHPSAAANFYSGPHNLSVTGQANQSTRTSNHHQQQSAAIARAAAISNPYAAVARAAVVAAAAGAAAASQSAATDPFVPGASSLCMPSILCSNPYSPAGKHPNAAAAMMPMTAAVQFQPSATFSLKWLLPQQLLVVSNMFQFQLSLLLNRMAVKCC